MNDPSDDGSLIWFGVMVEGTLALVALALAWFGLFDQQQRLSEIDFSDLANAAVAGTLATIPMLLFLVAFHFFPTKLLRPMKQFVEQKLYPMFRRSTVFELLLLAIMAGLGEELLFRWCLQGGIATILQERSGPEAANLIGLLVASILFGLCHWVNASYGLTTLLIGVYLGLVMIWSGTFLVPAVAHALYDFIALLYISRFYREPPVVDDLGGV